MREAVTPEAQLKDLKYQLAQLAYDQFCISLSRSEEAPATVFDDLAESHKHAWTEAVWAAVEVGKSKTINDKLIRKELDNGYIVFMGAKTITKNHPGIYTYSKLPLQNKIEYRSLALKVYQAMENQSDEERVQGFAEAIAGDF